MRSVIFLSTPTSANGSQFRALAAMARPSYRPVTWVARFYAEGRMEGVSTELPPPSDHLIKHNAPERFNPDTPLRDYRFILNARDPRDLLCNQFHWQFNHPIPGETPEEEEARRRRVLEAGIDDWVLAQDYGPLLYGFFRVARRIAPPDRLFTGYAMYCLHFEEMMDRAARFMGTPLEALPTEQREALARENVANVRGNPAWIGQAWSGADLAPGRHRRELQPETIRRLTGRYAWYLEFLRRMDDPRMAATYD